MTGSGSTRALLATVAAVTLLAAGAAWFLHDLNQAQWATSIPAAETGSWGT